MYRELGSFPTRAEKTILAPSWEMTGGPEKSPLKLNVAFGGGVRYACTVRRTGCGRKASQPMRVRTRRAKASQTMRSQFLRPGCPARATAPDCDEVAIQRSSRAISTALCQRESGSFARQPRIT